MRRSIRGTQAHHVTTLLNHQAEAQGNAIGEAARREIGEILEQKTHLFLFVKVRENWGDDSERYREMGLDFPH